MVKAAGKSRGDVGRTTEKRSKRPPGTGYLGYSERERKWIGQYRKTINGKVASRYCRHADKGECARLLRDLIYEVDHDELRVSPDQTLAQYLTDWMKHMEPRVREHTHHVYFCRLKHVVHSTVGAVKLSALKPAHLNRLYDDLLTRAKKPLSATTVHDIHVTLSGALNDAVEEDLIPKSPARAAKPPRPKYRKAVILSRADLHRLWEGTADDERWGALWVLLPTTGLRIGEALALRWSDLDLDRGTLHVEHTVTAGRGGGLHLGPPKTEESRRMIDLPRRTVRALKRHKALVNERRLGTEDWTDHDYVFPSKVGELCWPGGARDVFYRALDRLGLPRVHPHDLRHAAATILLQDGESMQVVQRMLGHSSITMTMDLYGHVSDRQMRDAADRMDRIFEKEG